MAGFSTGGVGVVYHAGSGGRDGYQVKARAENGVLFAKGGGDQDDGKAGAGKSIPSGGCMKSYFFLFGLARRKKCRT